jgi:hypothetical protein
MANHTLLAVLYSGNLIIVKKKPTPMRVHVPLQKFRRMKFLRDMRSIRRSNIGLTTVGIYAIFLLGFSMVARSTSDSREQRSEPTEQRRCCASWRCFALARGG